MTGYYLPLRVDGEYEYFTATAATVSVWSPELQHGGPPSGLLTRTLERFASANGMAGMVFSRITIDILGPIALGENRIRASVLRPGRQIAQLVAELECLTPSGEFRTAARATAWLLKGSDTADVERYAGVGALPDPAGLPQEHGLQSAGPELAQWAHIGFVATLEHAAVPQPHSYQPGDPTRAWLRPTVPLVAGEQSTPLQTFLTVIDVANGLGARLQARDWTFMNTDTTVHFYRPPVGEWVGITAEVRVGPVGVGATEAEICDVNGPLATSAQTLLLQRN